MKDTLKILAASACVYSAMAACSATSPGRVIAVGGETGAQNHSGSSGAPVLATGGAGGALSGGASGTWSGPVPTATAQPMNPQQLALDSSCDKTYTGADTFVYMYAEFSVPGKTMAELAGATVLLHQVADSSLNSSPPGYEWRSSPGYPTAVRDGSIAVVCSVGAGSAPPLVYDKVRIIL